MIDDGSTDGTADLVQREFPSVRLLRHQESRGYVVRRNEAARLATGDVVCSIDDDAIFSASSIVGQVLAEFSNCRIGAVAIPFIDVLRGPSVRQKAPEREQVWITDTYIGTAHAVRRDIFLQLGGYREYLVHQGEETDFCIRMLDSGYFVRLGSSEPIHHFESPKRDLRRMDFYGCRNGVLLAWQNTPASFLPLHLGSTTLRALGWTLSPSRLKVRTLGLLAGWVAMLGTERKPVKTKTYKLFRRLRKCGPIPLDSCTAQ